MQYVIVGVQARAGRMLSIRCFALWRYGYGRRNMLDVFFTVDVEIWCDNWHDLARAPEPSA